jgi:glutamyl-tRNA synthetase
MLEELARKYALQNALLHDGKADPGAVIGKVIASDPALKSQVKEIIPTIRSICDEVNGLSLKEQRKLLEKMAPELLEKKEAKKIELADLPNVKDEVVVRFAPGPSGPLHIGHTRAAVLNNEYVERYGGKYIIRLEDTNPNKIDPEAYDSIIEDLKWLGISDFELSIQSDRFDIYYEHARKLLEMGKAYVCTCDVEDWRSAKLKNKACPHREVDSASQLELWDKMLAGGFEEGEASYVVKTDINHPNPAVRDFVGFRIVKDLHPRTGDKYKVYPLYNFSVAIDDYLMGMTHVLRGKDHLNNTYRQEYVFDHFDWKKPTYVHYGLVQIVDTTLKTTLISEGIKKGEFSGWDDIRLATLKALARRGITAEAIREYWFEVGIKEVDIKFSWDNLYAYNKDVVDDSANRYFFVWSPKRLTISGINTLEGHAPLHPDHPERGVRKVQLSGEGMVEVLVTEDDLSKAGTDDKIRLKDLCNIRIISENEAEHIGDDISIIKEGVRIIHWVSEDSVPTRLFMPDGTEKEGFSERIMDDDVGKVVQFERMGFVRVDKDGNEYLAYFAHR